MHFAGFSGKSEAGNFETVIGTSCVTFIRLNYDRRGAMDFLLKVPKTL